MALFVSAPACLPVLVQPVQLPVLLLSQQPQQQQQQQQQQSQGVLCFIQPAPLQLVLPPTSAVPVTVVEAPPPSFTFSLVYSSTPQLALLMCSLLCGDPQLLLFTAAAALPAAAAERAAVAASAAVAATDAATAAAAAAAAEQAA
ncbi:hypothetical protein Emag_001800 [Eimeria magna]